MAELRQKILLVEDDPQIAMGLVDALDFEGFDVVHAKTGQEGVQRFRDGRADCVILDLMLPDTNGYKVCETLRTIDGIVPILMLTARSQESDKIRGLDAGADDYVTKPFSVGELIARIRAITRRAQRMSTSENSFRLGTAQIDPVAQTLEKDGQKEVLSFYEVQLLKYLYDRAGQVVSRDEILERIWGTGAGHNNRTVDNFIVKLRRKVEPLPDKPQHILTIYGLGYKLVT